MKKKLSFVLVILMVASLAFMGCTEEPQEPEATNGPDEAAVEVYVSAAASLTDALTEIQTAYAKESNTILQFNFAASGTLQKQIQEGAPCDLFVSASKSHMDILEEAGMIVTDTRRNLLGNALTLIAAAEKADVVTVESLTGAEVESISIGTPESVPAGRYAQESLENMEIWGQIQDKLVLAKDVRQVLEYVDTGNVDCGLVYKSDALMLDTGVVISDLPEDSHSPIIYPAALIVDSEQADAAAKFYDFLQSDYAKGVFVKYGFTVL